MDTAQSVSKQLPSVHSYNTANFKVNKVVGGKLDKTIGRSFTIEAVFIGVSVPGPNYYDVKTKLLLKRAPAWKIKIPKFQKPTSI